MKKWWLFLTKRQEIRRNEKGGESVDQYANHSLEFCFMGNQTWLADEPGGIIIEEYSDYIGGTADTPGDNQFNRF
jgi:hypothetical protein